VTGYFISHDDLFRAAITCSIKRGKYKDNSGADPDQSRATEQTFVLVAMDGKVIDRLPLQIVEREAVKRQDTQLPDIAEWLQGPNGKLFGTLLLFALLGGSLIRCISPNPQSTTSGGAAAPPSAQSVVDSHEIKMRWECEDSLKAQLVDPRSYEVEKVEMAPSRANEKGAVVSTTIKFRSKNGFGGMRLAIASCSHDEDGELIGSAIVIPL
jgi:hypothetical protein